MARCQKCLSFQPEELEEIQEAANNCCNGNVSRYFSRLHKGSHSATKIKFSDLERLIRKVFKEESK